MEKLISHTEESCLACPLKLGEELCVYIYVLLFIEAVTGIFIGGPSSSSTRLYTVL